MRCKKILFPLYNHLRTLILLSKRIKGKKNVFSINNIFLTKSNIEILGSNNLISIDSSTKVSDLNIFINGDNNAVKIGVKCNLKKTEIWIEDNNCKVIIGDFTTIESAHLAATENNSIIVLGEDCMLAKDVVIRTGDSHSIISNVENKRINYAGNVTIGNHVWIGERVVVLKGVTVNDNVIIGTGSILTSDCPENTISAGVPAKVIKDNVTWKRERIK